MEQCKCPECGNWMKFHLCYFCGTPRKYYTCTCGYDERNQKTHLPSICQLK